MLNSGAEERKNRTAEKVNEKRTAPWAGNFLRGLIWRLKREILSSFQRQNFSDRTVGAGRCLELNLSQSGIVR